MSTVEHWDRIWSDRDPDGVTWFQETPRRSLDLITSVSTGDDPVVDVGGGASRLVDHLLDRGYRDVTVVDLASDALAASRARLGERAGHVTWIVGDARTIALERPVAVWHDRAVFHFLVDDDDRRAYLDRVREHLRPGGHVVIATFAPDGPDRCSGLPVQRYDADGLAAVFGPGFELIRAEREVHVAPTGITQAFQSAVLRRA
jgi:SAM-dependent methyltransferase